MSDFSATQADLQAPNLRLTMAAVGPDCVKTQNPVYWRHFPGYFNF